MSIPTIAQDDREKKFACEVCGKKFVAEQSMLQHKRDAHSVNRSHTESSRREYLATMKTIPRSARIEIAYEVLGDLPDGAFFAAAESEFGLRIEDFINEANDA